MIAAGVESAAPPAPFPLAPAEGDLIDHDRRRRQRGELTALRDEYEQFLAFKRARTDDAGHVLEFRSTSKPKFKPSALQASIHRAFVNGKYCMLSPVLFLETIQAELEDTPFVAHPALLRGLFSWEFGAYGLPTMHFARRHRLERRAAERRHNFGDVSTKIALPAAVEPIEITAVMGALELLLAIVRWVYQLLAVQLVETAKACVYGLTEDFMQLHTSMLQEIVFWIDRRFQKARTLLVTSSTADMAGVIAEFQSSSVRINGWLTFSLIIVWRVMWRHSSTAHFSVRMDWHPVRLWRAPLGAASNRAKTPCRTLSSVHCPRRMASKFVCDTCLASVATAKVARV